VNPYEFQVRQGRDGKWRWTLVKPTGSVGIRSTSRFDSQRECRDDARTHREAVSRAAISTVH
jgi:hypothetical protein